MADSKRLRASAHEADENYSSGSGDESETEEEIKVDIEKHEYSSDESDGEGEDANEKHASVARSQKPVIQEAGRVLKIDLWDFMCHRRLEVSFQENITCVSGSNGSGKSAIVNALQICLGASASSTGRAEKLCNFIRDGSQGSAKIQVTLTNNGPRAYRQDILGNTIIVERILTREGATQSKLLNGSTKKVMFTKKSDIENMCQELSIYVDNPCCVLDQEAAKKFLKGSAKDKYEFFLKATDLQTLRKEFQREHNEMETTKAVYKKNAAIEEHYKQKYEAAKKEWESLAALSNLSEQLAEVEAEFAWATVKEARLRTQAAEEVLAKKTQELEAARVDLESAETEERNHGDQLTVLQKRIEEAEEDYAKAEGDLQKSKLDEKNASKPFRQLRANLAEKEETMDQLVKRKQDLERKLQKLINQMASAGGDTERLRSSLERKQRELNDIKAAPEESIGDVIERMEAIAEQHQAAHQQRDTAKSTMDRIKQTIEDLKKQIHQEEMALKAPRSAKYEHLSRFRVWLPNLMESIDKNQARFKQRPIFVGQHVKLTRQEYIVPVEQVIGGALSSFIVFHGEDESLLKELADGQRVLRHELVIFRVPQRHDRVNVSSGRPAPIFLTFEQVLHIDNDHVYNLLVNNNRIESLVLVDSLEQGKALYQGTVHNSRLPDKVTAVYEPEGSSLIVKGGSRIFETLTRDSSTFRLLKPLTVRSVDNPDSFRKEDLLRRLKHEEDEMQRCAHELTSHERSLKAMAQERDQLARKERDFETNNQKRTQRVLDLEREIDELFTRLSDANSTKESLELESTKDEIKLKEGEIEAMLLDIQQEQEAIKEQEAAALAPLRARAAELKALVDMKRKELDQAKADFENIDENYNPFKTKIETFKKKVEIIRVQVKQAAEDAKKEAESVVSTESQAVAIAPTPLDPKRSSAELKRKKNGLEAAIEQEEMRVARDGETNEARLTRVKLHFERAKRSYETLKSDRKIVEERLLHMKKAQKKRKRVFKDHRRHAEETTKEVFSDLLRQKGHDGDVIFDHENSTIEIKWFRNGLLPGTHTQKDADSDEEDAKPNTNEFADTKALSGGERSTTTLALLLALGRNLSVPFRVMDEFDVFMDAQARKVALQNIMTEAQEQTDGVRRQYILLSPQEFSTVDGSKGTGVHKIRMKPNADDFGVGGSRLGQTVMDNFVSAAH